MKKMVFLEVRSYSLFSILQFSCNTKTPISLKRKKMKDIPKRKTPFLFLFLKNLSNKQQLFFIS